MSHLTTHTLRGIPTTLDQVTLSPGHEFVNDGVVDLTKNTSAFQLPTGTTGQRPTNPAAGYLRWNTSQDENGVTIGVEYYDGSNWYKYGDRDPETIAEEEEYDAANPVDGGDGGAGGITGQQEYTNPGTTTWTCPSGVTSVCVVCIGAGGAGGAAWWSGGGGGGGGLGWKNNITVSPGTGYTIQVGSPGQGSSDTSGSGGSASYFWNSSTCQGAGGCLLYTSPSPRD